MHPWFQVPEIVSKIISFLPLSQKCESQVYYQNTAALLALGLTCRALYTPTMDTLWRSPALSSLMYCLPEGVWDNGEDENEEDEENESHVSRIKVSLRLYSHLSSK